MKLADRIEQGDGPSRELDAEIWCEVHGCTLISTDGSGFSFTDRDGEGPCWQQRVSYTKSLDAAMTLLPKSATGWSLNVDGEQCEALCFRDGDGVIGRGNASTPALALCAAAVRAQEAGE